MQLAQLHLAKDYQYVVEVSYDYFRDCANSGGSCDGICRCAQIENEAVVAIQASAMADVLLSGGTSKDVLTKYLVERLVKLAMKPSMFMILTCRGYYGEEIESVNVDKNTSEYKAFAETLETFNRLKTVTQRVQMILTLEYGSLLPEIAAVKKWEVRSIPLSKLHVDAGVLKGVSKEIVKKYHAWPPSHGVMGVVVPKGVDGFRLVDGFHRYSAWILPPHYLRGKKVPKVHRKITVLAPKV